MGHDVTDINAFRKSAFEWAANSTEHFGPVLRYDNGFVGWYLGLIRDTVRIGTMSVPTTRISIMIHGEPPKKYMEAARSVKGECQQIIRMNKE